MISVTKDTKIFLELFVTARKTLRHTSKVENN